MNCPRFLILIVFFFFHNFICKELRILDSFVQVHQLHLIFLNQTESELKQQSLLNKECAKLRKEGFIHCVILFKTFFLETGGCNSFLCIGGEKMKDIYFQRVEQEHVSRLCGFQCFKVSQGFIIDINYVLSLRSVV